MSRSLLLGPGKTLRKDLSLEELRAAKRDRGGVLWIDLKASDDDTQTILSDVFAFHPLAIEDCYNDHVDTPKIDDYGDYLFVVAQSIRYVSRTDRLSLFEIDTFVGPNYVVTVRQQEIPAIDDLFDRASENGRYLERGADFLTHTILDSLIDLLLPSVEEMDEAIDDLERRILDRPDRELLPEVLLLKRNTLRLRRSILPQRDMVNRLSRGEFSHLIRPEAQIFYRDVYDHIVRVEEMLDGLRDLADGALSSYLSSVNNRMNEVMKAMSVVAVIFLPLTLIASIYGTNLDFSPFGIEFRQGFLLMLGAMIAVAAATFGYFRYRGWF
ncbi:MAG TPA: magnesium/cobalt transporter CorA [Dehalococcoidia bacterium]|nr:magnesium/cobalt transporter CorA [Dehalococcoidia bacterium]